MTKQSYSRIEDECVEGGDVGNGVEPTLPFVEGVDLLQPRRVHLDQQPIPRGTLPDILLFLPRLLGRYFFTLCGAYGISFVAMVFIIYGIGQGIGEEWQTLSSVYFYKNVLELKPEKTQRVKSAAKLPWNIKPIFGMLSDTLPLWHGLRRAPYLVIAGSLGTVAWLCLAAFTYDIRTSVSWLLFMLTHLALASPDVIIDGAVTERIQRDAKYASDLQSLSWGSLAVGGIVGCSTSGCLLSSIGITGFLAATGLTALVLVPPSLLGHLVENRVPKGKRGLGNLYSFIVKNPIMFGLVIGVSLFALLLSLISVFVQQTLIASLATLAIASIVPIFVFLMLRELKPEMRVEYNEAVERNKTGISNANEAQYNPGWDDAFPGKQNEECMMPSTGLDNEDNQDTLKPRTFKISPGLIAGPAAFLFLREAVQPLIEDTMYYWLTDEDNKNGPHFSQKQYGFYDCAQYVGLFLGVCIYNRYMSTWKFRKVFFWAQLGIPDMLIACLDTAAVYTFRRFFTIPSFVLASKIAPNGMEAMFFALAMALSNFGISVGEVFGGGLVAMLDISSNNYDNMPAAIFLRSIGRALPIIFIPLLVPDIGPNDSLEELAKQSTKKKDRHGGFQATPPASSVELSPILSAPSAAGIAQGDPLHNSASENT